MNEMLFLLFISFQSAYAAQNYVAERDPPIPEVKKQYRLILHTPDRSCNTWRKVTPVLEKSDLLISDTKRDEVSPKGKPIGCRFTWVISPSEAPGAMKFVLESLTSPQESFEVPAPEGYRPAAAPQKPTSYSGNIPGVANENGNGPATGTIKGSLKLPGIGVDSSGKVPDPSTGK